MRNGKLLHLQSRYNAVKKQIDETQKVHPPVSDAVLKQMKVRKLALRDQISIMQKQGAISA